MALHLADKWIWDFWLARQGPDYHIFYMQAPRALGYQLLRHWHTSIGHAVSQDLRHWEVLPDALQPTAATAWDNYTWSGSIICREGVWHMFYTGGSRTESGLVQRIGLATSTDLLHWSKHPANPVLEVDPRWYEPLNLELWHDQAWRDPCVFQHPQTGQFHVFITARRNTGPTLERAVFAHARSPDLRQWEILPPVAAPGLFGDMEVPQLVHIRGRYYLVFCTVTWSHAANYSQRTGRQPVSGTHYLAAEGPLGPFEFLTYEFLAGDAIGSLYNGKVIEGPDGGWYFMATTRWLEPGGEFQGSLTDPYPVQVSESGRLAVDWPGR